MFNQTYCILSLTFLSFKFSINVKLHFFTYLLPNNLIKLIFDIILTRCSKLKFTESNKMEIDRYYYLLFETDHQLYPIL